MNFMKRIITLKIFLFALTRVDTCCNAESICATNEKCFKVFSNEIFYDTQNYAATEFDGKKWHKVNKRHCECPCRCAKIFKPVCAYEDGTFQIFSSKCALNEVNCEQNQGWQEVPYYLCKNKKGQNNCPIVCSKLYAPVCVYDGYSFETLTNICFLDFMNCLNDEDTGLFSIGECPKCLDEYTNELY